MANDKVSATIDHDDVLTEADADAQDARHESI